MKKRIFALTLALSLLLCACGGGTTDAPTAAATDAAAAAETSGVETTGTEATAFTTRSVAAAETYHISEQVSDNMTVDADVIGYSSDGLAAVYTANPKDFTAEEIQAFVEACGNTIEDTSTSSNYDYQYYRGTCTNGYKFSYGQDILSDNTPYRNFSYTNTVRADRYMAYPIFYGEFEYYTNPEYTVTRMFTMEDDFSFASAEDAEAEVREKLSYLGLSDLTLLRTLRIDYETLTKAEELVKTDENYAPIGGSNVPDNGYETIEWTEDDNAYVFCFGISAEGTVLSFRDWNEDTVSVCGCNVVVWYTCDGISCLYVTDPFEVTGYAEEPAAVVSAETALAVVTEKYSYLVNYQDIQIEELRLEYRYVQDRDSYLLKPIWAVRVSYMYQFETGLGGRYYEYINIDALTGEEE